MADLAHGQPPRWPAEWEPQSAVLLAWPTEQTDWAENLEAAISCYIELISTIRQFTPVVLCLHAGPRESEILRQLPDAPQPLAMIRANYCDAWLRDSGPITLLSDQGPSWLDFRFNAWDGEFGAAHDNKLVQRLRGRPPLRKLPYRRIDWVLEGGAVETDGRGTILASARCLEARLQHKTRRQIETMLCQTLHCDRVLWLEHGAIHGDDTDGHIDILARFADPSSIVFQGGAATADPESTQLNEMARELESLQSASGNPYQLHRLPAPDPVHNDHGERLPATYANFLITNDGVLMPCYGTASDADASAALRAAFPNHQVVGVDCRALLQNGGSLHCVTMQLPEGVVHFEH